MGLLSFLKRKSGDTAARAAAATDPVDSVQQARTRARQRLIGATVLVAAGVIGFPILFESQPRPLPGDTAIEIARADAPTPAVPSRAQTEPEVIRETAGDAGRELPVPPEPETSNDAPVQPRPVEAKPERKPEPKAEVKPEPKAVAKVEPKPKPEPKPESKPAADTGSRAQALLEGKPVAATTGRFIVQVGAFADAAAAREARQKVEKLGLKTYTQVVETSSGKRVRVRVGPFSSRDEADKASSKIKSAGLVAAVFTL